jgi:hypothetical protein
VIQKFAGFLGGDNNISQKCPFASGGIDMFNSAIIDVAIGMVLTFLAVSLAASAITEAISSFMKLREKTLLKGIQGLLNDQDFTGIARDLYNHALVNPLASGEATVIEDLAHKPAYIDSRQFSLAIYSKLSEDAGSLKGESTVDVIAKIPDPQLKTAMASCGPFLRRTSTHSSTISPSGSTIRWIASAERTKGGPSGCLFSWRF